MEQPIKEFTISRVFDAPQEVVWNAWMDPKLVQQWWGPRGVTNPTCEWDPKPGGKIRIVMLAGKELGEAAGQKWPMNGVFKEVTPKTRLVFASSASDDVVGLVLETMVTVNLTPVGNKTKIDVRFAVTKANQKAEFAIKGAEMGWNSQMDKLGEMLGG
ncbi:MAG: SRPBCC domain-containing protein [Candidatus Micrarchaeota archaeon]|nr:SRPBCC domain-containing protein [Candidatus Micrarchaeota archaeon]